MYEVVRQSIFEIVRILAVKGKEETDGETKKCMRCERRTPINNYKCPNCGGYKFLFDDEVLIIR